MRARKPVGSFTPGEIRRFISPIAITSIGLMLVLIAAVTRQGTSDRDRLIIYGAILVICTLLNNAVITRAENFRESYGWLNAILAGVGLGLQPYILPESLTSASHIFVTLGITAVTIVSGRWYGYASMLVILALGLPLIPGALTSAERMLTYAAPYLISLVVLEAVARIQDTTHQHIHRLETINKVSRQLTLSIETEQTMSLLSATIQDALEADSYFVGILKSGEIQLDLYYDDGEYFNGTRIPARGTLFGWVIQNERELFLPDLRKQVQLDGVKEYVIGKKKPSLSWVGVPLVASNVRGVLALGSYRPNAFDRADVELLSNLAQHIATALDNTFHHAQVEEQARLDSLTGVYNHGYFLKRLAEQAAEVSASNATLSLIMLDVDYFKQYNDTYGHLVGDHILKRLCEAIRSHIKESDTVGRWGGEEFIIALPGSTGEQAVQVAERIGRTMEALRIEDRKQQPIPAPTVSQGVAVYPLESDEIYQLIDLADRRLYIAKKRGRNQVEPDRDAWKDIPQQKT